MPEKSKANKRINRNRKYPRNKLLQNKLNQATIMNYILFSNAFPHVIKRNTKRTAFVNDRASFFYVYT